MGVGGGEPGQQRSSPVGEFNEWFLSTGPYYGMVFFE
jgi:hypothetical protein